MTALRPRQLAARTPRALRLRPLTLGLAGLGLVGVLAGCSTASTGSGADSAAGGSNDSGTTDSGGTSSSGTYKDGDYTASGSYQTPDSSTATIDVAITMKDNVVSAVTVTPTATSGNSKIYQERFASGISDEAVGKKLEDLSDITRVAGSSLTHEGFEKAVEKIEKEAAA